jgi:pimeloyl-ACP methyl ester carboxylesterase
VRRQVQQSVLDIVSDDTRVMLGHSLGSIVAYEVLCAHPELPVRSLVTLGSPLGLGAVHRRLRPPVVDGRGQFPHGIERWTNIADAADMVALVKDLAPIFGTVTGGTVDDVLVYNGATMHDVNPYLTAVETGRAVAAGLQP